MRKFLILAVLALMIMSCSTKKEEQYLIKGDDAGYLIFTEFLNEFNFTEKDSEFNFVGGGVQPAINSMVDRSSEFVFSLKKLNNEDLALFKTKSISPVEVPLFTVPIMVIGNSNLPIDKLNQDEVKKVFSGLYKYWWQLASNKKDKDAYTVLGNIDLCTLDQRNGENHFMRDKLHIGDFNQDARPFGHPNALIDFVAHNAGSIGYVAVPYYTTNKRVEKLKILFTDPDFDTTAYLIFDRSLSDNPTVKRLISKFKDYLKKHNARLIQKGIKIIE